MATEWHEQMEKLRPETQDMTRALQSFIEELEAVSWYQQRVDAATDPELKQILQHHANEEKEHAVMLLEWVRRRDPRWDEHLREYLFKSGNIVAQEAAATGKGGSEAAPPAAVPSANQFTVGNLRGRS
ncbi:MAG: ferritin-like domain-containing protein [Myxococcota bacterium]